MASIKVKFRPSTTAGKEGTIYYQIIQNRVIRQLKTDFRLFTHEWNNKNNSIIIGSDNRYDFLQSIQERINWDVKRLQSIIGRFENMHVIYTADDIISTFNKAVNEQSLFNFMQGTIAHLKQMGKIRTAENYSYALKSFMQFRQCKDVALSEIDSDLMQLYEVPLSAIKRIKNMNLSLQPNLEFARDMFLFSSYTRGMAFVDMAYLKKSDLQNGSLSYRRRKTGQLLVIKWERCMQEIINKYSTDSSSSYLLPILKYPYLDSHKCYRNILSGINRHLKEIAKLVNISTPLSMYCARHSWASAAKYKNIPLSVISEGMGHDSESTTQIYLASLDNTLVDNANAQILKSL